MPASKAHGQGRQRGADVRLACASRGVGMLLGLDTTIDLLLAFPGYREIMQLPPAERAVQMRDSERRARVERATPAAVGARLVDATDDGFGDCPVRPIFDGNVSVCRGQRQYGLRARAVELTRRDGQGQRCAAAGGDVRLPVRRRWQQLHRRPHLQLRPRRLVQGVRDAAAPRGVVFTGGRRRPRGHHLRCQLYHHHAGALGLAAHARPAHPIAAGGGDADATHSSWAWPTAA